MSIYRYEVVINSYNAYEARVYRDKRLVNRKSYSKYKYAVGWAKMIIDQYKGN